MIAAELYDGRLVDEIITLDKDIKKKSKKLDEFKAEIQKRGLVVLDDQNMKYTKYFGKSGSCAVSDTMSLKVLNTERLRSLLPDGIFKDMVTETTETKYKYDSILENVLKAIFNDDYSFEMSLEEFLDNEMKVDPNQKKLLLKKLKGDYVKDRKVLFSVMGYSEDAPEEDRQKYDVELWYIYKIKNAELIKAVLPDEGMGSLMEEIRKCLIVESKTSISLDYKKET